MPNLDRMRTTTSGLCPFASRTARIAGQLSMKANAMENHHRQTINSFGEEALARTTKKLERHLELRESALGGTDGKGL